MTLSPLIPSILLLFSSVRESRTCLAFAIVNGSLMPSHLGLGVFINPCIVLSTWAPHQHDVYEEIAFTTQQYYSASPNEPLNTGQREARQQIDYVTTSVKQGLILYGVRPTMLPMGLFRSRISKLSIKHYAIEECFVVLPRRPYDHQDMLNGPVSGVFVQKVVNMAKINCNSFVPSNRDGTLNVTFSMPPGMVQCPQDVGAPLICDFVVVALLRDTRCNNNNNNAPGNIYDSYSTQCDVCTDSRERPALMQLRYQLVAGHGKRIRNGVGRIMKYSGYCRDMRKYRL